MHTFQAMNTTFSTAGLPEKAQNKTEQIIRDFEERFSRFRPANEMARLNQTAGQVHTTSPLLYEILTIAHTYYTETSGLFNPYLSRVLSALGYSKSFETLPVASVETGQSTLLQDEVHEPILVLDPHNQTARLRPDAAFDPGGIAKGWSADYVRRYLTASGLSSGLIDAGGDIAVWGMDTSEPWGISIADPFCPDADIAAFWLRRDAGIATSSSLKRSWGLADGRSVHHILDPRTHTSAVSDLVQVTIIAPHTAEADVYAKTMLILGSVEGEQWIHRLKPELAYVLVTQKGSVITGGNVSAYCTEWEEENQCHI